MALEQILVYQIVSGDNMYPHWGSFTVAEAGTVTIDDSNGSDDAIFGDFTHTGGADVPDQDVVSSTVAGINTGDLIDLRYKYTFTGNDGSTGTIFFIATNQQANYGPLIVSDTPLDPSVIYTFGTFNTDGATPYNSLFICFAAGTLIATPFGERAVETLAPGDNVLTLDNGFQPIRWLGARQLGAIELDQNPNLRPIRIAAGALGPGTPHSPLTVSPQHRIFLRSPIAGRMFGSPEMLVPVKKLLSLPGIDIDRDCKTVTYVHFLCDTHQLVLSNGAITESLHTGPEALQAVAPEARDEILTLFPDLATASQAPLARPEARQSARLETLISRHLKNGKALQAADG